MKKFLTILALVSLLVLPQVIFAADYTVANYSEGVNGLMLGSADLQETVINTINWILSLLVLIAVIIILIGGFKWMTAAGNEEKVGAARKTIISGIVGLIIVLAAYAIAQFAVQALINVSGVIAS